MLKLHGFAVSNYFNMVRIALETKGIPYEVVQRFPSQDEDWLSLSPIGKVPCLETPEGTLAETIVILEYLDDSFPDKPLIPGTPFEKGLTRQLMQMIKLYIELPARRLYPGVFFGGKNSDAVVEEVKPVLEKGVRALNVLGRFDPYLMGAEPTAADFMLMYSLDLATAVARKTYDWDMLADIKGSKALLDRLNEDPIAARIAEEKQAQMAAFLSMRG
jgi:glutathione S-transferase